MEDKEYTKTYEQFLNCEAFKRSINLDTEIQRNINFIEGRQWSNEEGTEDYPKITLNFMKQIMKVRQAGILQNDYSFLVNTNHFEETDKIQYFMKYLYNSCKIKKKNLKVIADNFKKGTSGLYFYWDSETRNILSNEAGKLKCDVFDIRQLGVADPYIQDIQEQEYIIYKIREKVGALKHKYPNKKDEIYPDGWMNLTEKEQVGINEDEELASVYIKYYRNEDGQVCYRIDMQNVELQGAEFLNPNYNGSKKEMPNTLSTNDIKTNKKYEEAIFGLYPFAVFVMDERDNCFYGIPGAYEYIEAQKSKNAHFSTYDFALSQNVLGGFAMREGILGDQEITTDNAQIINLKLKPGERIPDVFGRIPVNQVPADALNYSNMLGNAVKEVSGATNVQMGQADYSNQTAKATEMLIARAKENSSDYAILFEEYMRDIANIMFMFSKFYYDNKAFNIVEHGNAKNTNFEFKDNEAFKGENYISDDVDFDIQVSPSQAFSETVLQQLAMTCVQTGNLKMLAVLKMLPYNTFPSFVELKDELIKEDTTQQIMKQQEATIQQQEQVMQQMTMEYRKIVEDMNKKNNIYDTLVQENLRLKEQMGTIYAKSIQQAQGKDKSAMAEALDILKNPEKEEKDNKTESKKVEK